MTYFRAIYDNFKAIEDGLEESDEKRLSLIPDALQFVLCHFSGRSKIPIDMFARGIAD